MSTNAEITANIIGELIDSLAKLEVGKDLHLSMQEFALGIPNSDREIDLCYGYAKIPATNNSNSQYEAVFGKGLARITTDEVSGKITRFSNDFAGLNFTTLLPPSTKYQNVYAFANVFLSQTTNLLINNPSPTISTEILKGETSGSPIFMSKDLSIEEVLELIYNNEINEASGPENPYVKIFDVLIEINYFDPDDVSTKDVILHFVDKRCPRGWGGFADEYLATYLTPSIIDKYNDYSSFYQVVEQNIYNLVNQWINLRIWSPSFIDYWQANSDSMPESLKNYLELRFSIII